ncbi:MAG: hypothetical protein AVDCRST_MAG51-3453 [uncultured Ramlibacter sp.]|uniref:Uncharacterized protein n=1 Tax=uncultured Ramlibacter sp. TaxID=260755 RepID=A0A6J4QFI9_9BURK|nr:MAG: hypothetical protein AVDCRST_MAG51-3453 [uncultured Ramlibacter sp.]
MHPAILWRELDRVAQQVPQHLLHPGLVRHHQRRGGIQVQLQVQVLFLQLRIQHVQHDANQRMHVHHARLQADLAGRNGGEVQQVLDQAGLQRHVALDHRQQVLVLGRHAGGALQQVGGGGDGRQRRAQLVRQHGQEAVLGLVGALGFFLGRAQRLRVAVLRGGVVHDLAKATVLAGVAVQRHEHALGPQAQAVAPHHPTVVVGLAVPQRLREFTLQGAGGPVLGGEQLIGRLAHHVLAREAEDVAGGAVPRAHHAARVHQDHGVVAQRVHHPRVHVVGLAQPHLGTPARLALRHLAQGALDHQRQPRQPALADVVGRASLEHLDGVVLADHAGDEDERRIRAAGARHLQRLFAREAGDLVVREDQVEVPGGQGIGEADLVTHHLQLRPRVAGQQALAQQLGVETGILDQQDGEGVVSKGVVRQVLIHTGERPSGNPAGAR